jgi:hypothetical protein
VGVQALGQSSSDVVQIASLVLQMVLVGMPDVDGIKTLVFINGYPGAERPWQSCR